MASRGKNETDILHKNLLGQLDRLIDQLKDIEECKDDMSSEEYSETKQETLDQLNELNASAGKFKEGNLSLVDDVNSIQLAIQAAISQAFQTPEVIQMFAKKQHLQLRQRLADIEQNLKLGKTIDIQLAIVQKVEILCALQKLNEKLTAEENEFLQTNKNNNMKQFEVASSNIGLKILDVAGSNLKNLN